MSSYTASKRPGTHIRRSVKNRVMRGIKRFLIFDIVTLLILLALFQLKEAGFFTYIRYTLDVDRLKEENCPEELIRLYEKNPDTRDFVMGYKENADKTQDIDISSEASQAGIPLFMQWDKRWGYETYGSNMMALTGCGPTSLSMVYTGLTGNTDMDPFSMAIKAESEGFYVWGSGSSWDMMDTMARELGLTVYKVGFDENSISEFLGEGNPIICSIGPGDFTESGHFIVLTGIDSAGNISVNDPNSKQNSSRTWTLDELMPQIMNLWGYSY